MTAPAQPARSRSSPATFMDRFRGSVKKKTSAFRKRLSGCINTGGDKGSTEQPSSVPDFLSCAPGVRQNQPQVLSVKKARARPQSEYFPKLHFDRKSNNSLANISEMSAGISSQFSGSEVSLPSSFAAPGWEIPPADLIADRECNAYRPNFHRRNAIVFESPDDFEQHRTIKHDPVELVADDMPPGTRNQQHRAKTNCLPRPGAGNHVAELPASVQPAAAVESTRVPLANSYQPYPGTVVNKPVSYVIPVLQAGYVGGVPPNLRAGHARHVSDSNNGTRSQHDATKQTSKMHYSWPLIDFQEEMFLNTDPSRTGLVNRQRHHPKHQEPRIPSMDFSEGKLEEEVSAMLGNLQAEERVADGRSGFAAPVSPLEGRTVHEMEAAAANTRHARVIPRNGSHPGESVELEGTRYVTNIPSRRQQTLSPVSPMSSDGARVSHHEYNWPRFSEVQRYEDPAEEYSRRYRDRRRDMRRERVEESKAEQRRQPNK
ncbi:hypothetical protein LTS15_008191 [Exophiala xenobiotica]|nr:hypothetical protein LTS15_008191 [Exophiala xenobiotica]